MTDRRLLTVIHPFITKLFQDLLVLPARTTIRMQFIRMWLQGPRREESGGTWAPHFWATWSIPLIFLTNVPIPEDETLTKTWHCPRTPLAYDCFHVHVQPPAPLPLQNALRGPQAGNIDKIHYPIILKPREWTRIAGFVFSVLRTCRASKYCTEWDRECLGQSFHLLDSFINEYSPFWPGSHVWEKMTPSGGTSYIVQHYAQFMVSPLYSTCRCSVGGGPPLFFTIHRGRVKCQQLWALHMRTTLKLVRQVWNWTSVFSDERWIKESQSCQSPSRLWSEEVSSNQHQPDTALTWAITDHQSPFEEIFDYSATETFEAPASNAAKPTTEERAEEQKKKDDAKPQRGWWSKFLHILESIQP